MQEAEIEMLLKRKGYTPVYPDMPLEEQHWDHPQDIDPRGQQGVCMRPLTTEEVLERIRREEDSGS